MKSLKYLQLIFLRLGVIIIFLFPSKILAEPYPNEFEELCSEVITSRLQTEPSKALLLDLYKKACFVPVWIKEEAISPKARELFHLIKEDRTLPHSTKLFKTAMNLERESKVLYEKNNGFIEKIELELALSKLYKTYAQYKLYGSIDWEYFYKRRGMWVGYKPRETPESILEKALNNKKNLEQVLLDAEPKAYHYKALKKALYSYLDLRKKGVWEPIVVSHTIRAGEDNDLVPIIRERLRVTGDDTQCLDKGVKYDSCLETSVIRFQKRHGLAPDGVIGKRTIAVLNRDLDEHIDLIKLNLDRIKWFNQRGGNRHIIVNIPAFTLYFEEDGMLRLQMKVITGKRKNRTPVFSNTVQQIVLNPAWNVPKNIVQKEMIPQLLKNPNAMVKEGIDIYTGWGKNAEKVDAESIDWAEYRHARHIPFRFTQPPGQRNALGKVKFLFPNRFSVYMHDTPSKYLFSRTRRAFSHGCIRLEKPLELLSTFVSFNDTISDSFVQRTLKGDRRVYLKLDTKVPVDIVYLTAWVDYDGVLQFRDDIYGYDKIQLSKMKGW